MFLIKAFAAKGGTGQGVWRTINGSPVFIQGGTITKGPASLVGSTAKEAKSASSKKSTKDSKNTTSKSVVTNKNVPEGLFGNKVVTIEGRYGTERFVKIEKGSNKGKYAMLNDKGQVVDNNGSPARFNGVSVADGSRYSIFTEQGLKAFAKPTTKTSSKSTTKKSGNSNKK